MNELTLIQREKLEKIREENPEKYPLARLRILRAPMKKEARRLKMKRKKRKGYF